MDPIHVSYNGGILGLGYMLLLIFYDLSFLSTQQVPIMIWFLIFLGKNKKKFFNKISLNLLDDDKTIRNLYKNDSNLFSSQFMKNRYYHI